ncbi:hypothetical protein [Halovenus marina]|uniref:hypothetical protein n=1 Tax=Halovenus marina TaxID=3396621 RepID=UPI003F54D63F
MVVDQLQDFGARSLVTHALMALSLVGAIAAALFLDGETGRISFVALLNFTAGLWVCQSIHALGNPDYRGIISVVRSNDS